MSVDNLIVIPAMKYRGCRIAMGCLALSLLSAGGEQSISSDPVQTMAMPALTSSSASSASSASTAWSIDQTPSVEPPARVEVAPASAIQQPIDERVRAVRGAYLSAPAIWMRGAEGTARMLRSAGLNAAVIDFKDSDGRITEPRAGEAPTEKRPVTAELLKRLDELGVYTIARIVCFSDPVLPRAHKERAVLDGRPKKQGQVWADWGNRNTWLDPYHPENQRMVIELSLRAQALGFHEVQLDYIRFPVDEATTFAVFPSQTQQTRSELLTDLMRRVDEAIEIPLGVDVFGTTAFRFQPQDELGQDPKQWMHHVQVFSPMLYMNKMRSYMAPGPRRAERLVRLAVTRMREQVGPTPVIRPFLQAFERGADYYTPEFIAEQIKGAHSGSANGYLFWDPAAGYRIVRDAHRTLPFAPLPRVKNAQ